MTDTQPNILLYQQGTGLVAPPEGFEQITNPLNPLLRSGSRLSHFTEGVYDLSPESHLVRLLKVLLGESGLGGIQRQMLLARLQQMFSSTHFFDLDAFYGAILGARRNGGEALGANPYSEVLTPAQWDEIRVRDAQYRSRVSRMSSAVHRGATTKGIELVAEALSGVEFESIESWMYGGYRQLSWEHWEASTWDDMEAYTWDELERTETDETDSFESLPNVITLYPMEPLTEGQRFDIERVIDRVKPPGTIVLISEERVDLDIETIPFYALSASERWELRQLVQNSRINGILPYPNDPEDAFIEAPVQAFSGFSGQAWTLLDKIPKATAYSTVDAPLPTLAIDPSATPIQSQAISTPNAAGMPQVISLPEFALKSIHGIHAGRSVSDGIISGNPFAHRSGDQTGMFVDGLGAEYMASRINPLTAPNTRFWTTPVRSADSPIHETLEIRFDEPVLVNHIAFEYASFPCTIEVQVWDRGIGEWIRLAMLNESRAIPFGIGQTPPPNAPHPYHYGDGHWQPAVYSIEPITARQWRFICARKVAGGPVGVSGDPIGYPLGIRNLDFGYRVKSRSKVPHVPALAPVVTTSNALGLQTRYYLDRARASYVEDADADTAWICEPQPMIDAVVNLYLIVGSAGIPRVVNQLWMDPVHSGVVANLYYTSSAPQGNADGLPADEVVYPTIIGSPVPTVGEGGNLSMELAEPAAVLIDARSFGGGSASGSWWLGLEWQPFVSSIDGFRLHTLYASDLSGTPMWMGHGYVQGEAGAVYYSVWIQANGRVARVLVEDGLFPVPGQTIRAVVQVNSGVPQLSVRIGNVTLTSSEFVTHDDDTLSLQRGFAGTFDPVTQAAPDGESRRFARTAPVYLSAIQSDGSDLWVNSGTAGSAVQVEIPGTQLGTGYGECIYLPGVVGNHIEFPESADSHATGDIGVIANLSPERWAAGVEQTIAQPAYEGTAVGDVSWRWYITADGKLAWDTTTDGSTIDTYETTDPVIFEDGESVWISVLHDVDDGGDNTVTFSQLNVIINDDGEPELYSVGSVIEAITVAGTYTRYDAAEVANVWVGESPITGSETPFEGRICAFAVSSAVDFEGIYFTPSEIAETVYGSGFPEIVVNPGALSAPLVSDDPGGVPNLAKIMDRPAIMMLADVEIAGTADMNPVIAAPLQFRAINLVWDGWLETPSSETGVIPLVTKKASALTAAAGWGIYHDIANSSFLFRVSDGTTQVTATILHGGWSELYRRHITFTVTTDADGDFTFSVAPSNEVDPVLSATITPPSGTIYNSEPVRLFADGADADVGGSVSLFAYDPTPSKVGPAGDAYVEGWDVGWSDTAMPGSAWTVTRSGRYSNFDLTEGDVIFFVPPDGIRIDGAVISGAGITAGALVIIPAGHAMFGSSMVTGANMLLTRAVLGYGVVKDGFLDNPDPYTFIPPTNVHSAEGTFLRFHPSYIGWQDGPTPSVGFMGGAPDSWSRAEWKPIGQAIVSRGTVRFPDVAAIAIKLELTNLVVEPYESFLPIDREVARFGYVPPEVQGRSYSQVEQATIELLSPNRFGDTVAGVLYGQDARVNFVSPTAGISVIDGGQRDYLNTRFGFGYGMSAWQQRFRAPIQEANGQHQYAVTVVQMHSRTAFFCGFRSIEVQHVQYRGRSDGKVYDDTLLSAVNLDTASLTLEYEPGQLYTPEYPVSSVMAQPRTATSKPYYSRRPVTALQFSTQQTGPQQVIPDDEFRNPTLPDSSFDSDSSWHRTGDGIVFWDLAYGTVRVSRDPAVLEAYYRPDSPIVHPIITPVLSSGFGRTLVIDQAAFGGISSPTVRVSPGGILYVGARASAVKPLEADLWLRVYASDGSTLLGERSFRPQVGVPTEVVLPFVLGASATLVDGVRVSVEQDGPYRDSWVMHSLSAFDTSILWEFTVDDGASWLPGHTVRGLKYGVLDFPIPGTALRWRATCFRYNAVIDAVRIRPWYRHRFGSEQ